MKRFHLRVLVCGGRDYTDQAAVFEVLDKVHRLRGIEAIIHGAAKGADSLGGAWAQSQHVLEIRFPADWDTYGKSAGFRRNEAMLLEGKPDVVIAFPGGKGTLNMIQLTIKAGVALYQPIDLNGNIAVPVYGGRMGATH